MTTVSHHRIPPLFFSFLFFSRRPLLSIFASFTLSYLFCLLPFLLRCFLLQEERALAFPDLPCTPVSLICFRASYLLLVVSLFVVFTSPLALFLLSLVLCPLSCVLRGERKKETGEAAQVCLSVSFISLFDLFPLFLFAASFSSFLLSDFSPNWRHGGGRKRD